MNVLIQQFNYRAELHTTNNVCKLAKWIENRASETENPIIAHVRNEFTWYRKERGISRSRIITIEMQFTLQMIWAAFQLVYIVRIALDMWDFRWKIRGNVQSLGFSVLSSFSNILPIIKVFNCKLDAKFMMRLGKIKANYGWSCQWLWFQAIFPLFFHSLLPRCFSLKFSNIPRPLPLPSISLSPTSHIFEHLPRFPLSFHSYLFRSWEMLICSATWWLQLLDESPAHQNRARLLHLPFDSNSDTQINVHTSYVICELVS